MNFKSTMALLGLTLTIGFSMSASAQSLETSPKEKVPACDSLRKTYVLNSIEKSLNELKGQTCANQAKENEIRLSDMMNELSEAYGLQDSCSKDANPLIIDEAISALENAILKVQTDCVK